METLKHLEIVEKDKVTYERVEISITAPVAVMARALKREEMALA
jgi:hypothetical protein